MAQKVMINSTYYDMKPSPVLIDGTKYQIGGRTLVDGTGYDVKLGGSLTWFLNDYIGDSPLDLVGGQRHKSIKEMNK